MFLSKYGENCLKNNRCILLDTLVSGSPIIQNGKLIGAVTHVLVDDPTKGYGIFAENMLETAQSVAESNKLKDASQPKGLQFGVLFYCNLKIIMLY